ncbi:hypothetical protein OBBRIDRAFT_511824 [Obba rivulosa]|uniref:Uncharacterized protein n=1 Tax=Obba rivulosa TaxID=1052685 RepID=A0A8E2AWJ3_9APHY|nr:hypothetical protein OBBRIDRAFT_511824 [Obba rivulosa]
MFTQAIVAVLLIMRTFSLYNRNKWILTLMLVTTCVGGVISIWSVVTNTGLDDVEQSSLRFPGCNLSLSEDQARHLAGAWSSMLGLDTLIFVLTVVKVIQARDPMKGGTLRLMLRDGAIYYGIIVITVITNIVTFLVGVPTTQGLCTVLTNVASSMLVSRLMLNLRDPDRQVLPIAG